MWMVVSLEITVCVCERETLFFTKTYREPYSGLATVGLSELSAVKAKCEAAPLFPSDVLTVMCAAFAVLNWRRRRRLWSV